MVTLPKNCWSTVPGPVVIQLYAGECRSGLKPEDNGRAQKSQDLNLKNIF